MRREGWIINHKKIRRIYSEEKLQVRCKKVRRRKLPAVARVAPAKAEYINQIWTMDFVHDELADGRKIRCLTLVDKFSREALAIPVNYRLKSQDVVEALDNVRLERALPEIICVDNGSEFTSLILEQYNNWRPHRSLGNITPREFARRKLQLREMEILLQA